MAKKSEFISEFDKTYNISYIENTVKEPDNNAVLRHYLASCFLYGMAILLYSFNNYFHKCLNFNVFDINIMYYMLYLYLAYIFISPILYFGLRPKSINNSNNYAVIQYILKLLTAPYRLVVTDRNQALEQIDRFKPTYKEGQAVALYLIRLYFIPTITSLAYGYFTNANNFYNEVTALYSAVTLNPADYVKYTKMQLLNIYRNYTYLIWINAIFFIDALIMLVAYFWISFKDSVKTVDTSAAGLMSCLVCYMPFYILFEGFVNTYPSDYLSLLKYSPDNIVLWIFYVISSIFILIILISSCSLFTKTSNLMNKGIVTRFPYNIVRHPYYFGMTGFIWSVVALIFIESFTGALILQKVPALQFVAGAIIFGIIYTIVMVFRALTEERHLSKCPDYREYCKKVRYRFIPYVW